MSGREGVVRVREEGEEGGGRRGCGRGGKLERKGRREKEEILRVLRWEDGDKGVGVGDGLDAYPLPPPSCMLKCVPCVCLLYAC